MSNFNEEIVCHTCDRLFSSKSVYDSHNCNDTKMPSDDESESPPFDILSIPSYQDDSSLKSSKSSILSTSSKGVLSSNTNSSLNNYNSMEKISPDSYQSHSQQSSQSSTLEMHSIDILHDNLSTTNSQSSTSEDYFIEENGTASDDNNSDELLSISINSYSSTDYNLKDTLSSNGDNDSTEIDDLEYYFNDDEVSRRFDTYSSHLLSNPSSQRCMSNLHNVHKIESDLIYILKSNRLPNKLYDELMTWASNAHFSGYFDRDDGVKFHTALKKLADSCCDDVGGAPLCTTMNLPNLPSIDVHHSSFMKHAYRLLNSSHLMCDANWTYQYNGGQRSDLNTGSWWKNAEKKPLQKVSY